MCFLTYTVALINLVFIYRGVSSQVSPDYYARNLEMCNNNSRNPYFDKNLVIGKPWRIYYTWNMNMANKCFDLVFQKATKKIIDKFEVEMGEYLEQPPYWDTASLHVTMFPLKHEVLLFPDQGPAGRFVVVPNLKEQHNYTPITKKSTPPMTFQMKLLRKGKFLLIIDCFMGVASLAARSQPPPYRLEVAVEAATLDIGTGNAACIRDKNKDEQFVV